ncbi:MAG: type II toxin-antitoxin system RelE/ParE family toxin [Magnetococcales bacterium]|nr:type II toxin-antitoxin system RelE/ParE family toxin [Magnetococcales bacterium]MBF0629494.1 type II toxin-antitoxin system RelE/ParE family toxin [Magnetococcales bacterium]
MNWTIVYYSAKVKAEIDDLPAGIHASLLRLYNFLILHGVNLRLPHSRAMGNGLFELRPKGKEGIGRVFYCTQVSAKIVILHSFIKKKQETPARELEVARKRLKEVRHES